MSGKLVSVSLDTDKAVKIKEWKVKEGILVSKRQTIFIYEDPTPRPHKKQLKFQSKHTGIVSKIFAKEGDIITPGSVLLELEKHEDKDFIDILNKEWKVFRVSPLFNFSFKKFKYYEGIFNKEMNSRTNMISNYTYKSNFSAHKSFKLNDQYFEAFQVKVLKDEVQTVYVGHFVSLQNVNSDIEGSVSLPILLVEAKVYEMSAVHSTFIKVFDCDIQSVTLSLHALISFFVKLLEIPRSNIDVSQQQVTMEYGVPECAVNDKINISLCLEDTTVVFAVVMDNLQEKNTDITSLEVIEEFYKDILNHIHKVYSLNLTHAELRKVAFPDAFLTSDGQLKISTDSAAISALDVLKHFTSLETVFGV